MPTYDAILGQDTQFLTAPVEVSRATHYLHAFKLWRVYLHHPPFLYLTRVATHSRRSGFQPDLFEENTAKRNNVDEVEPINARIRLFNTHK